MSSTTEFAQSDKNNYSNKEKLALGELVEKYKKEYDEEVELNEGKSLLAINIWKIFQFYDLLMLHFYHLRKEFDSKFRL